MKSLTILAAAALLSLSAAARQAIPITTAGQPAQLDVRSAGAHSLRVTLKPISFKREFPATPAVADRTWPGPAISLRSLAGRVERAVGRFRVAVESVPSAVEGSSPLRVTVRDGAGRVIQTLRFEPDGPLSFDVGDGPVLGMGEGGPRPVKGTSWREQPVQFDRRGALDTMEPRWQADMYGSRNPAAVLFGTSGWGLFVATPWVQIDLTDASRGKFLPVAPPKTGPQNEQNQQQNAGKGLPPADQYVAGLYDVFVFDAAAPTDALNDFASITGRASMPPRWALGYMQSHRTLEDETQMLRIIDTFREKRIPLDAVIYLGTGFAPVGWNTRQPSFDFNPNVFKRDPKDVLADMHARHVKVVVHMVPWDRDRLPTLHGTIPAAKGETVDASHIQSYWQQHVELVRAGVDAFWPDEGDWFNLFERIKRHQLYYQGSLSTTPNVRPWSLQRNGFPGIAQWGGWVWSGDTDTSWKTLEAQIAVGLNYSLSIGPYWGSDIGGFYPNREYTGELYARWFQFAAFCGSFRAHGRVWQMRLPWSWGGKELGPLEYGNNNQAPPAGDPRSIDPAELGNPAIEPIAKRYAELRYQLMPYTYTLAREARDRGLPLMRALWLHYPADATARSKGDQFLWGRDLLIAPVYTKGATTRAVYLPAGDWYDWWTKERVAGGRTIQRAVDLATMPIYARAGAVVPVDPIRQYTDEPVSAPTTLRVFPGANGDFTLYDDDGISQDYLRRRGNWIRMAWNDATRTLTIEPGAASGATDVVRPRAFRVVLPDGHTQDVSYAGRRVSVAFQERPKVGDRLGD
jgi:alpha-glucosidase (family GH31 glycosyl hydrolase)